METVVILGAGIYQVPLIQKVKDRGFSALVVTPKGNYPGIQLADNILWCDTRDHLKVFEAVQNVRVVAVVTTGTDVAIPTMAYLAEKLHFNTISYENALKCSSKVLMKECFRNNGVTSAEFIVCFTLQDCLNAARTIGYPCMIKATNSSGSRGIFKVEDSNEIKLFYNEVVAVNGNNSIIIEEFLNGIEFGAQVVVTEDVVEILYHGDIVSSPPVSVPIGHFLPLKLEVEVKKACDVEISKAISALGIKNTISNVDLMLVNGKPYIIEIGARMGATCLPENLQVFTGIDFYDLVLDLALDKNINLPDVRIEQANVSLLLFSDKSGELRGVHFGSDFEKYKDNVVHLHLDVSSGDVIRQFKVGSDRLGHLVVKGNNLAEAIDLAKKLSSNIHFLVN